MCELGDLFSTWILDCASVAAGIGKSECPAAQALVAKAQTGHLFTDCVAYNCGAMDRVSVKQYFHADCSFHCQSIVEDFEVQQPEMAITFSVHRQTRQSIQRLCLVEPALSVGQPSHS